ncbi:hypothetical protein [uncultured Parasphingorhabdus sp.]|uniref:hypothetical protein n=1 Tax=uncultured Parasphingorhabdus sp. TaxID=2709694 RepID=UPI002AA7ED8C|nr:hypothetical protein [uncultured Parasphingorhabdus sp.]
MIACVRLQRRQFGSRRVAFVTYPVQRYPQGIGGLCRFLGRLHRLSGRLRGIFGGLAADKPAERQTAQKSNDDSENDNDRVQNDSLSDKNEKGT